LNARDNRTFGVGVGDGSAVGFTVGSAGGSTVTFSAVGSTLGAVVRLLCWFRGYIGSNVKCADMYSKIISVFKY
jgi:hypothetical protein